MGLEFGKEIIEYYDFGWSYRGFNSFRKRLAKEVGVELDEMNGFGGEKTWETVENPIALLLHHSDCEGFLSCYACEKIYPELLKIIKSWPDEDFDKITAIELVNAMKECAVESNNLIFC